MDQRSKLLEKSINLSDEIQKWHVTYDSSKHTSNFDEESMTPSCSDIYESDIEIEKVRDSNNKQSS
jgi:hypothetical protein